jgi:hypothetical protein
MFLETSHDRLKRHHGPQKIPQELLILAAHSPNAEITTDIGHSSVTPKGGAEDEDDAISSGPEMIRVVASVIGFAILISFLTGGNKYAIWAALIVAAVGVATPLLTGRSALKCPYCRKRVKLGATVCHHCGRSVARDKVFPGGG